MGDLKLSRHGKDDWNIEIPIVELLTLGAGATKLGNSLNKTSPLNTLNDQLDKKSKKKEKESKGLPTAAKAGIGVLGTAAGAIGTLILGVYKKDRRERDEDFELEDSRNKL